jgi:hypothetical protein
MFPQLSERENHLLSVLHKLPDVIDQRFKFQHNPNPQLGMINLDRAEGFQYHGELVQLLPKEVYQEVYYQDYLVQNYKELIQEGVKVFDPDHCPGQIIELRMWIEKLALQLPRRRLSYVHEFISIAPIHQVESFKASLKTFDILSLRLLKALHFLGYGYQVRNQVILHIDCLAFNGLAEKIAAKKFKSGHESIARGRHLKRLGLVQDELRARAIAERKKNGKSPLEPINMDEKNDLDLAISPSYCPSVCYPWRIWGKIRKHRIEESISVKNGEVPMDQEIVLD